MIDSVQYGSENRKFKNKCGKLTDSGFRNAEK